ncbi:MAG TPA: hypothetical protein VMQ86_06655 [Bryobacteraceae bacterium]|jgi:hypothetical protein|nr:hypothetical protein [Bryobacteraceae bacterium]
MPVGWRGVPLPVGLVLASVVFLPKLAGTEISASGLPYCALSMKSASVV